MVLLRLRLRLCLHHHQHRLPSQMKFLDLNLSPNSKLMAMCLNILIVTISSDLNSSPNKKLFRFASFSKIIDLDFNLESYLFENEKSAHVFLFTLLLTQGEYSKIAMKYSTHKYSTNLLKSPTHKDLNIRLKCATHETIIATFY